MNKSRIVLIGILLMLALSCLAPIGFSKAVGTTTSYYEDFNSDTNGANPIAEATATSFKYTYAETAFTYANVNTTIHASKPFYVNQSIATSAQGYANFTFNSTAKADSFAFYFRYNNDWRHKYNHSGIDFKILGASTLLDIYVYGANHTLASQKNKVIVKNSAGTEFINKTVSSGVWYYVTITFTWYEATVGYVTNGAVNVDIYNASSSATLIEDDSTLPSSAQYMNKFQIKNNASTAKVNMFVDNLVLTKTVYSSTEAITNNLLFSILPVLLALAIFAVILGIIFTMGATKESLITILLLVILGVICIQILFSLM